MGPQGPKGDPVTITVNGTTYTQSQGNITLPDYPADVAWGNITGTLSSQTDLQSALNAKADVSAIPTNYVTTDTRQNITGQKGIVASESAPLLMGDAMMGDNSKPYGSATIQLNNTYDSLNINDYYSRKSLRLNNIGI